MKVWFKNAMIYRLTRELDWQEAELDAQLSTLAFTPCSAHERQRFGWQAPLENSEMLHFRVKNQILLVAHKEEKLLPSHVVKSEADLRIQALEDREARPLKKAEKQAIKDEVENQLLPRAFSRHQKTLLWIDLDRQLIWIDCASSKRAEDCLALLRKCLGSLPVVPLQPLLEPRDVMTKWLRDESAPHWLTLGEEAELKADDESQVRCKNQPLDSDEIQQHIQRGKQTTRLALDWETHFSFVLNDDFRFSRLKFADEVREKNDVISKADKAQRFDADFVLMYEELGLAIDQLLAEFGGMKPLLQATQTAS